MQRSSENKGLFASPEPPHQWFVAVRGEFNPKAEFTNAILIGTRDLGIVVNLP